MVRAPMVLGSERVWRSATGGLMPDNDGPVVLVTGASGAIGVATLGCLRISLDEVRGVIRQGPAG